MANIRDLAKVAKVSVSTVSRVLNNYPYVKQEKREAVLQAIRQLNYYPNINAIHLSKGKTMVVGILLPFINHSYYSTLLEGIAEEANSVGYKLMIIQTYYQEERELEALEMLKYKQIDSLVIASRVLPLEKYEEYIPYGKMVMCEKVNHKGFQSIYINQYEAFRNAYRFLVNKGHRDIGYCTGRENGSSSLLRKKALANELNSIGKPIREDWIFPNSFFLQDGNLLIEKLLKLKVMPSALIVTNDMVAAGTILESKRRGINIPTDLAIIGFNNDPIAEAMDITTISLPLRQMGREAFKNTLSEECTIPIEMPFSFIERNTV
ncbi:LacI family DNA-binding transcriptional regulator [Priestia megaterium]|uniref:LacI family DNA-binding transcriptional regulator n=1 Tax=Priestia megaterium TaxID=1404 RepID=UPI00203BD7F8|nr:LacI family DNA-binding transcriptional regulator [Priestia megaterium]MCM3186730.1 LacI family DNA-binding transcriptional regulator [Priestia megaterium]